MPDNDNDEISQTLDGEPPYFAYSAALRIFGNVPDFDVISRTLGVKPTHVRRKGERKGPRSPAYREDAWFFQAPVAEDRPLDEHVQALWTAIEPSKDYLLELKQTLKVDVFCGYRSNHWAAGFHVEPESLAMFVALQIPFGVSVIVQ
jgi:hypothetical protein